ncbi:MAG: Asp-tRNA(Asn)/Glu-tRNA(Gln) amidotransferase subunit GatC [Parachlamydiaceae bacterium]|nr:Asp-tRNA(Asn)/Glu-tRNA(Gln) amidotransferase subunit GatC [Parachlamydiaceae bacterium]
MAKINKETIKKLTKLSHIQCTEDEEEKLLGDLQSILNYIEQLSAINTDNIPPCTHVSEGMSNVEREDVVGEMFDRSAFLANAPDKAQGLIRVPLVMKE